MSVGAKPEDGEKDLAVLFPGRSATIADRIVAMRELNFVESLQHGGQIASLAEAMSAVALQGQLDDLDSLRQVFADRHEQVLDLIAVSCDQEPSWVRTLDARDGENLLLLWWAVHADFFLRRVLTRVQLELLRKVGARDGQTSSRPSPNLGTTRNGSVTTPTVS
ncbi:DUF6631 family protein [Dyella japonica]|uniref:Uncharacterized protein n=1 Tax=Dyella japonica TaxID=231455 RepID=A0ABV2JUG5_9GAMM